MILLASKLEKKEFLKCKSVEMTKGNRADCVTTAKFKEKQTYPFIHMHYTYT